MKTKNILFALGVAGLMGSMQSCDSFLDTMPDKRTEINTPT